MFSVNHFIEEGIKFIIPPPKYHPPTNPTPVYNPSSLSEKMPAEPSYHPLVDDSRASMESLPSDSQRLLDPDPQDTDSRPPAPKKGVFRLRLSYHPTVYLRLLVLCLFISAFGVFIASQQPNTIPSIVFLSFAILRNIVVLYCHFVGNYFIRVHIEIVGLTSSTSNSKPKKWHSSWFQQRLFQIAIDWILIGVLIATSVTAKFNQRRWYSWAYEATVLPACILTWIAL